MLCVFNGYMCSGYRSSDFHKFDAKCSSLQVDYLSGRFPLRSLRNIMRVCLATCAVKIRYWPRHARYLRVTLVKSYVTRETLMRETCVSRAYSSQTTCKIDCKGINYFRKMRVPSKLPANCTVWVNVFEQWISVFCTTNLNILTANRFKNVAKFSHLGNNKPLHKWTS